MLENAEIHAQNFVFFLFLEYLEALLEQLSKMFFEFFVKRFFPDQRNSGRRRRLWYR